MILPGKCWERKCKYFIGVHQPDGTEMTERIICQAYFDGIPDEIMVGKDFHLKVRDDQENELTFEEDEQPTNA